MVGGGLQMKNDMTVYVCLPVLYHTAQIFVECILLFDGRLRSHYFSFNECFSRKVHQPSPFFHLNTSFSECSVAINPTVEIQCFLKKILNVTHHVKIMSTSRKSMDKSLQHFEIYLSIAGGISTTTAPFHLNIF